MATISLAGSASGLIKYTNGSDVQYFEKTGVYFSPSNAHNIRIACGGEFSILEFDNETQRDAAITTLLTYF